MVVRLSGCVGQLILYGHQEQQPVAMEMKTIPVHHRLGHGAMGSMSWVSMVYLYSISYTHIGK